MNARKAASSSTASASHGVPITRLLRDGMRFDNYVVATSCRSCIDAHCMVGCPVDAIHRGSICKSSSRTTASAVGCARRNCPYGSIFMMPNVSAAKHIAHAHPKAAACDLCDAEGTRESPQPRCVSSCPHEAAERMTGDQLLQRVAAKFAEKI